MSTNASEQTVLANSFGTITTKRVIYNAAKGWFSGGSRTDIPLNHVTSVTMSISRSIPVSVVLILVGLGLLVSPEGSNKVIGIVLLAFAGLLLWGTSVVSVNTSGTDLKASRGSPWQRQEADDFVEALRGQLFKDKSDAT